MKPLLTLTALLIFLAGVNNLTAQELEISAKRGENNIVEIIYQKRAPGTFTVALRFDNLTNTGHPGNTVFEIESSYGALLTLKPQTADQGIGYSYKYNYIRGVLKPKLNLDFSYLLPYAAGKKVKALEAGFANEKYFGAEKRPDWKSYTLLTDSQDTVFGARKGLVVEVIDQYDDVNPSEVPFTTKKNTVLVEHEDGALLRYHGFKKGSILVKPGEKIYPGNPLGLNTPVDNGFYGINLLLYYLSSADFESLQGQTLSKPKSLYTIIAPKFVFDNNVSGWVINGVSYTVFKSNELITKEMSKKELKKLKGF